MVTGMPYLSFKQILYSPGLGIVTSTRIAKSQNSRAKCGCFCMFEIIRAEERASFLESLSFLQNYVNIFLV